MLAAAWSASAADFLARMHRELPAAVESLRSLPGWTGWVLAAAGLWALLLATRFRRPAALAGAAFWTAVAVHLASGLLQGRTGLSPPVMIGGAAALLGLAALLVPPIFPALAGALAGAGLAALSGKAAAIGVAAGLGLVAGLLLQRFFAAAAAALMGAFALAASFFLLVRGEPATLLARHPVVSFGLACVLAVAGTAFQHARAWPTPAWVPRRDKRALSGAKTLPADP